jgi:hypothetical protein
MEGFVSGIYQFQNSLSATTVPTTIKYTSRTQMCYWELPASRQWFSIFVSISAGSKIPDSLMRTSKISHPGS